MLQILHILLSMLLLALLNPARAAPAPATPNIPNPNLARHIQLFNNRSPDVKVNAKRDYQWVCNSLVLEVTNMEVCANNLALLKGTDTCTYDPNNPSPGELCMSGDVYVSGVSLDGTKEQIECEWAADTINFLIENCGQQGGSAVANHDGNFIVHINNHWVF